MCGVLSLVIFMGISKSEVVFCLIYYYIFTHAGVGGFLPAVKQIANVAALPGIIGVSNLHNSKFELIK